MVAKIKDRTVGLLTGFFIIIFSICHPYLIRSAEADVEPGDEKAVIQATDWLVSQPLTQIETGDSIDLLLAGLAVGMPDQYVDRLVKLVEFKVSHSPVEVLVYAKAIVALDMAGKDVTNIVGKNLVSDLFSLESTKPNQEGNFMSTSGRAVFDQSWVVIALSRIDHPKLPMAVNQLLKRQCKQGPFLTYPDPYACTEAVSIPDQAIALNALHAAYRKNMGTSTAMELLVTWLTSKSSLVEIPVSAAAYLVGPYKNLGEEKAAETAKGIIKSLQITPSNATNSSHVGAIGAETSQLLQDLLAKNLDPQLSLTANGILGLAQTDLLTHKYSPDPKLAQMVSQSFDVNGETYLETGQQGKYLVQGAKSKVSATLSGKRNAITTGTPDENGNVELELQFGDETPGNYEIVFDDSSGQKQQISIQITDRSEDGIGSNDKASEAGIFDLRVSRAQAGIGFGVLVLLLAICAGALNHSSTPKPTKIKS